MALPVALYVPNLLGYARIITAFIGLHYSQTKPVWAICIWIFSASLDLIDGILARALNQCSSLGILLDIAADNILRTTTWIAVASQDDSYRLLASILISLEWATMVCTQLHAAQSGEHWKTTREQDPWWLRAIFANNFKTPLGSLCVYGLFSAGFFVYGSQFNVVTETIPWFDFWKYAAYCGRGITALAELYFCKGYLCLVIERDMEAQKKKS